MELWYSEMHTKDVKMSVRIDKQLCSEQSEFQRIDVFESPEFGRFLTLDGIMMLTEKDEFIYHEMITHVPMASNPDIKNVLVIGAGDGGTIRELTRYESIEHIDMVEIDERVVEVSKQYLPQTACKLGDPRVHIFYDDGLRFVRRKHNEYDLIIVDSTDPFGPGEGLFTSEFYGNCYDALTENGILVISMKARITPMMQRLCRERTSVSVSFSRFVGFIRRISRPTPRDTGSSASLQRRSSRLNSMQTSGTPSA